MKDNIRVVSTTVEQTVHPETGEVTDMSVKEIKLVFNPDKFCLVYAGLWNVILDSPLSRADLELLSYLIANYANGVAFTIGQYEKDRAAKHSKRASTSYNNSTRKLIQHKLIIPVDKKIRKYIINPRYAFEGSSHERNKLLIEITQKCPDC